MNTSLFLNIKISFKYIFLRILRSFPIFFESIHILIDRASTVYLRQPVFFLFALTFGQKGLSHSSRRWLFQISRNVFIEEFAKTTEYMLKILKKLLANKQMNKDLLMQYHSCPWGKKTGYPKLNFSAKNNN
jgi:hypothetical protein